MKEIRIKEFLRPLEGDNESSYRVTLSFVDDGKESLLKPIYVLNSIGKGRSDLEIVDLAFESVQRNPEIQKFLAEEKSVVEGTVYVPRAKRVKEEKDGDIR